MITIHHSSGIIRTHVTLPASKSISNRLLIINALSGEKLLLNNLSEAGDTVTLQKLLREKGGTLYCGDGGTTLRFLLAYFSLKGMEVILSGSDRLNERPVMQLVQALSDLGAAIEYIYKKNYPPLQIRSSAMHGGTIEIDASVSSQFISALMLIAPYLEGGLTINLKGRVISFPYIKMTASLMRQAGVEVNFNNNAVIVSEGNYQAASYYIEPDWSAASYWMMIASLSVESEILLTDMKPESIQGDARLLSFANAFGVNWESTEKGIIFRKGGAASDYLSADCSDCPDLVPALALLCAAKCIKADLVGLESLPLKESDRVVALCELIRMVGGNCTATDRSLHISPSKLVFPDRILPDFNDHRLAMALAALSLKAGKVKLGGNEVMAKSYPRFTDDLLNAGFEVREDLGFRTWDLGPRI